MNISSHDYEEHVSQIQTLRKQVQSEKTAHETTLQQLQATYQIVEELRDCLKGEQRSNLAMKAQVTELSAKLSGVCHEYEQQIREIKETIELKDEELRRMSAALMVNDYEVIRLKVVSELEVPHQEQLEELKEEARRLSHSLASASQQKEVLQEQVQIMKERLSAKEEEREIAENRLRREQTQWTHRLYEGMEREGRQAQKWRRKYSALQERHRQQMAICKEEMAKMRREMDQENLQARLNTQYPRNSKVKMEQLEEEVRALREQLSEEEHQHKKTQNALTLLRREHQQLKHKEMEWSTSLEEVQEEKQGLKRQLQGQDTIHAKALESLRRELESRQETSDSSSKREKEEVYRLQLENNKLTARVKMLGEEQREMMADDTRQQLIQARRELSKREQELAVAREEAQGERSRRESPVKGAGREELLERKLRVANAKIVELLKQKAQLKQQHSL